MRTPGLQNMVLLFEQIILDADERLDKSQIASFAMDIDRIVLLWEHAIPDVFGMKESDARELEMRGPWGCAFRGFAN